jgi:hypothetical protein
MGKEERERRKEGKKREAGKEEKYIALNMFSEIVPVSTNNP